MKESDLTKPPPSPKDYVTPRERVGVDYMTLEQRQGINESNRDCFSCLLLGMGAGAVVVGALFLTISIFN